jgi:hypothetical protein
MSLLCKQYSPLCLFETVLTLDRESRSRADFKLLKPHESPHESARLFTALFASAPRRSPPSNHQQAKAPIRETARNIGGQKFGEKESGVESERAESGADLRGARKTSLALQACRERHVRVDGPSTR